jgi:hypothetical protein
MPVSASRRLSRSFKAAGSREQHPFLPYTLYQNLWSSAIPIKSLVSLNAFKVGLQRLWHRKYGGVLHLRRTVAEHPTTCVSPNLEQVLRS